MHFLQAINIDISVLIVCNKTGGTIKGDIKKKSYSVKKSKEFLNRHVYFGTSTWSIRTLNFFVYVRPFSRITSFSWFHLKCY
jgi:hypothetical protein